MLASGGRCHAVPTDKPAHHHVPAAGVGVTGPAPRPGTGRRHVVAAGQRAAHRRRGARRYRGDRGGSYLGRYSPGKNQYFAEDQVSNEVSIRHDWLTGGDLFLIADQVNKDGSIDLKALQKPLVNLIWLAGFVFLGGALIALWPDAREERRLAERYAGSPVRI